MLLKKWLLRFRLCGSKNELKVVRQHQNANSKMFSKLSEIWGVLGKFYPNLVLSLLVRAAEAGCDAGTA